MDSPFPARLTNFLNGWLRDFEMHAHTAGGAALSLPLLPLRTSGLDMTSVVYTTQHLRLPNLVCTSASSTQMSGWRQYLRRRTRRSTTTNGSSFLVARLAAGPPRLLFPAHTSRGGACG